MELFGLNWEGKDDFHHFVGQGLKSSFASWEQHQEFGLLPANI
jgi:hypothetical protein